MGAGDDDIMTAVQEMSTKYLGEGGVVQLAVEDRLHLGISAGDGIADNDESILCGQVLGTETGEDLDAPGGEKVSHGRVGLIIRSGHEPSLPLHRGGHSSHGRPADAEEVNAAAGGFTHRDEGDKRDG